MAGWTRLAFVIPLLAVPASAASRAAQGDTVTLMVETALAHIGETARICGIIDDVAYRPSMEGAPTFLIFHSNPANTFVVVIAGEDRSNFAQPPEVIYGPNQGACMTGTIGEIVPGKTAGMVVRGPDLIELAAFTVPTKTHHVDPVYPRIARSLRIEGVVMLEAVIDEGGKVTDPKITTALPNRSVNLAALRAVREWRYTAATLDGEPIPVRLTVGVVFQLSRQNPDAGLGIENLTWSWSAPAQRLLLLRRRIPVPDVPDDLPCAIGLAQQSVMYFPASLYAELPSSGVNVSDQLLRATIRSPDTTASSRTFRPPHFR